MNNGLNGPLLTTAARWVMANQINTADRRSIRGAFGRNVPGQTLFKRTANEDANFNAGTNFKLTLNVSMTGAQINDKLQITVIDARGRRKIKNIRVDAERLDENGNFTANIELGKGLGRGSNNIVQSYSLTNKTSFVGRNVTIQNTETYSTTVEGTKEGFINLFRNRKVRRRSKSEN